MKPATFLASALAAAAAARAAPTSTSTSPAPAPASAESKRGASSALDPNAFNQFAFVNQDLQYLQAINGLDLSGLVRLAVLGGLDLGAVRSVFVRDAVDVRALLQLQQVALLAQLGGLGALAAGFDLAAVRVDVLDLGLLGACVGAFDLASLVDPALAPQLQAVVQQTGTYNYLHIRCVRYMHTYLPEPMTICEP